MSFLFNTNQKANTYSQFDSTTYNSYVKNVGNPKTKKLITDPHNVFWNVKTNAPSLLVEDHYDKQVISNLPTDTIVSIKQMLNPKQFILKQREAFIEVSAVEGHNSSFLLLPDLWLMVEKFIDLTPEIKVLVSDRINIPTYFGHENVLTRLAENSDYKYVVLDLEEVKKYV